MAEPIVTPGEFITVPIAGKIRAGRGVYLSEEGSPIASVVGRVVVKGDVVEVLSNRAENAEVLPSVGILVTGKVLRVSSKVCEIQILCVGETPVKGAGFKGVLRKENVRAFEVDQIDMLDCFRVGDIVTASVAALGGARSYELSTAGNHLGVIHATCSVSGEPMIPASWETMRCPITGTIEKRKVAKVNI